MPEIPPQAVQAAAEALEVEDSNVTYFTFPAMAKVALKTAAPLLAEHIARLLAQRALQVAKGERTACAAQNSVGCHEAGAFDAFDEAARIVRDAFPAGERSDGDAPARGYKAPTGESTPGRSVIGSPDPSLEASEGRTALRDRYAEALARWALMYPIPAWGLAEGQGAEKLARNWGRVAAKAVLAVRDDELERLRRELTAARAATGDSPAISAWATAFDAVARVRALHQPDEPPDGHQWVSGGRKPHCTGCDTGDPFLASEWPCETIRALDGTEQAGGGA